jgi:signal transduction histidine kinase
MSEPALQRQASNEPMSTAPAILQAAQAERLMEALCNLAGIAAVHAGTDGKIIFANAAFRQLNARCGGDSLVCVPGFADHLRRIRTSQMRHTAPQDIAMAQGVSRFWLTSVPVVDDMGKLTGMAAIYQDWTRELARVEEATLEQARFRDFARAASDFFWETDSALCLTSLSEGLIALLEKPTSVFLGKPLEALGRLQPNNSGEQPLAKAQPLRTSFRQQLLVMEQAAGGKRLFHLSAVPVHDEAGRFVGYRGAATDVTRAYRLEEEARRNRNSLEGAMAELQRNNIALDMASSQTQVALNAKNEFLAAMSHELRTPLNAIIGFAEAMELQVFGPLGTRYVNYANDIRQAGQHLLGLINEVLDVSVIESGEIQMSREPLSVARIIESARALIALRAEGKSIDLGGTHIQADYQILADERRTLQIFVNLLTNAVKFTPEGGSIKVDVGPAAHGQIAITVRDTGPGIAAADQERVFEKFQQLVRETYRGKPEGTGLGLHISRELARLMGGDIGLISEPGQGAAFVVRLPAA